MIAGVVASQASVADVEVSPIDDPLADVQFDTGSLVVGGVSIDLEDIIDRPENVIPGLGVVLGEDFAAELLGSLAALLVTGDWTVSIQWYRPDSSATPLEVNTGSGGSGQPKIRIEDVTGFMFTFDSYTVGFTTHERDLLGEDLPGPVSRGIGLRRTSTEFAMSLDAGDVVEGDGDATGMPTLTRAWIGGDTSSSYGPIVVHRLRVWDSAEVTADMLPQIGGAELLGVPACDSFASRVLIESGQTIYLTTNGCSKESGEPNHGGEAGGASAWIEFVAPATDSYTIRVWDATMLSAPITAVYTGSAVGSLTPVDSDVDDAWELDIAMTMGVSYKIALDGVGGEEGFFSVHIEPT